MTDAFEIENINNTAKIRDLFNILEDILIVTHLIKVYMA